MNTKAPPEPTGGALFQLNTSSPAATPPSSTDATDNNQYGRRWDGDDGEEHSHPGSLSVRVS
jgi:hypothetical protein